MFQRAPISPARKILRDIVALDCTVAQKVATLPPSPVDTTMRTITTMANGGALWLALASALATRGPGARRGARTGLLALAAASTGVHYGVKPLARRARPRYDAPTRRALPRRPRSTSFPSGHAASSAAFATAVALASPRAGALAVPLAASVAYSRVHVGVHWTSDVVAGSVLGALVAMIAGKVTR